MHEPDIGKCPTCGRRVAGRFRGGLCPACLIALALRQGDDGEEEDEGLAPAPASPAYRILTVLSGDAVRTTYLAEQQGSRSLVTLEVVRATAVVAMTPGLFDARLSAIRRLRHPFIARVLDGRVTAERDFCIIADYVAGQAADRQVETTGATAGDILHVFDQLCDAVSYAHGQGVVHGRLRPSAVVLIERGGILVPRLTGFSICERPVEMADDVRGLAGILVVMAGHARSPAALDDIVRRATHGVVSDEFPSVEALRDAVAAAAPQNR